MRLVLCFLSLALVAIPAWADRDIITAYGLGSSTSCGAYMITVAEVEKKPGNALEWEGITYFSKRDSLEQWAAGFVTATNVMKSDAERISIDYGGLIMWLRKYCGENPTTSLFNAVNRFTKAR